MPVPMKGFHQRFRRREGAEVGTWILVSFLFFSFLPIYQKLRFLSSLPIYQKLGFLSRIQILRSGSKGSLSFGLCVGHVDRLAVSSGFFFRPPADHILLFKSSFRKSKTQGQFTGLGQTQINSFSFVFLHDLSVFFYIWLILFTVIRFSV